MIFIQPVFSVHPLVICVTNFGNFLAEDEFELLAVTLVIAAEQVKRDGMKFRYRMVSNE